MQTATQNIAPHSKNEQTAARVNSGQLSTLIAKLLRATVPPLAKAIGWLLLTAFTGLLIWNVWFYIEFGQQHPFVQEKIAAGIPQLGLIALAIHIPTATICITASLIQLIGSFARIAPKLHRYSGRIYAYALLLGVAPTGFILGLYAKGGWLGMTGFWLMGVIAVIATIQGIRSAKQRNIEAHKHWMWRSYAMVATGLTSRLYHVAFYYAGLDAETNYICALWASVLGNIAITELLIWLHQRPRRAPKTALKSKGIRHETIIQTSPIAAH